MTEKKCQWEVCKALKAINHKLAFVTSGNPAATGRFMEENFSVKRHDATTIKNNMDDLQSDVVELVVGSSPSNLSNKSSPETDFIPEPHTETLLLSKCG